MDRTNLDIILFPHQEARLELIGRFRELSINEFKEHLRQIMKNDPWCLKLRSDFELQTIREPIRSTAELDQDDQNIYALGDVNVLRVVLPPGVKYRCFSPRSKFVPLRQEVDQFIRFKFTRDPEQVYGKYCSLIIDSIQLLSTEEKPYVRKGEIIQKIMRYCEDAFNPMHFKKSLEELVAKGYIKERNNSYKFISLPPNLTPATQQSPGPQNPPRRPIPQIPPPQVGRQPRLVSTSRRLDIRTTPVQPPKPKRVKVSAAPEGWVPPDERMRTIERQRQEYAEMHPQRDDPRSYIAIHFFIPTDSRYRNTPITYQFKPDDTERDVFETLYGVLRENGISEDLIRTAQLKMTFLTKFGQRSSILQPDSDMKLRDLEKDCKQISLHVIIGDSNKTTKKKSKKILPYK